MPTLSLTISRSPVADAAGRCRPEPCTPESAPGNRLLALGATYRLAAVGRSATVQWLARLGAAIALAVVSSASTAEVRTELADALERLAREGAFSGAVVILGSDGVRFAQGFGSADPFTGRRFTPDAPVDSASLAKPVTAAAVLMLAREGRIDLDAPVSRYLADYPHPQATVRHLLAHSAGLPVEESLEPLGGKTNAMLLAEIRERDLPPLFAPGTAFVYCNFCYTTLAMLIERVTAKAYLPFVRERLAVPRGVTIRPARLAEWRGRAIGHRRGADGKIERADSYENELFYGTANLSISAHQLARWGAEWWKPTLEPLIVVATTPASIAGNASGLSWGNWYCAPGGGRCHYVGHHEGFHHLLVLGPRAKNLGGDGHQQHAGAGAPAAAPEGARRVRRAERRGCDTGVVDASPGQRGAASHVPVSDR